MSAQGTMGISLYVAAVDRLLFNKSNCPTWNVLNVCPSILKQRRFSAFRVQYKNLPVITYALDLQFSENNLF